MLTQEDKALINELSLQSLSEEQQIDRLESFYRTLNMNVAMAVGDKLSDAQLQEFEKLTTPGNEKNASEWLRHAIPDYEQVVEQELAKLKQDIKQSSADFRASLNEQADG